MHSVTVGQETPRPKVFSKGIVGVAPKNQDVPVAKAPSVFSVPLMSSKSPMAVHEVAVGHETLSRKLWV